MDADNILWLSALFFSAFISATVLPGASEVLLAGGILAGRDAAPAVGVASLGNMLGALTTFCLGKYLGNRADRFLRIDGVMRQRAEIWISRWGSWLLLLSWLPVLGDPLVLAAGFLRMKLPVFFLFTLTGKLARYILVAWLTLEGVRFAA